MEQPPQDSPPIQLSPPASDDIFWVSPKWFFNVGLVLLVLAILFACMAAYSSSIPEHLLYPLGVLGTARPETIAAENEAPSHGGILETLSIPMCFGSLLLVYLYVIFVRPGRKKSLTVLIWIASFIIAGVGLVFSITALRKVERIEFNQHTYLLLLSDGIFDKRYYVYDCDSSRILCHRLYQWEYSTLYEGGWDEEWGNVEDDDTPPIVDLTITDDPAALVLTIDGQPVYTITPDE